MGGVARWREAPQANLLEGSSADDLTKRVGGRLQRLRAERAQVIALRTTMDSQDQALQQLVERAAERSGTVLPMPAIVWPSGKHSDPFDGPILKS